MPSPSTCLDGCLCSTPLGKCSRASNRSADIPALPQIFVTARPRSDTEALPLLELKPKLLCDASQHTTGLTSTLTTHNCNRNPKNFQGSNSNLKPCRRQYSSLSLWSSHAPTPSSPSRYLCHPEFVLLLLSYYLSRWNRRYARPTYLHHDEWWTLGWSSRWGRIRIWMLRGQMLMGARV